MPQLANLSFWVAERRPNTARGRDSRWVIASLDPTCERASPVQVVMCEAYGGPESLVVKSVPSPVPGPAEVRVRPARLCWCEARPPLHVTQSAASEL